MAEDEDGLALLTMLLDDTYHNWMYKPPELPPIGGQSKKEKSSDGGRKGNRRKDRRPDQRRSKKA
ncbi:MAG TPA: hypothetical protein DEH22_07710 [Chloroflexi bacterium]|nr:hypothetical protein [Chloroflexota bacterium]